MSLSLGDALLSFAGGAATEYNKQEEERRKSEARINERVQSLAIESEYNRKNTLINNQIKENQKNRELINSINQVGGADSPVGQARLAVSRGLAKDMKSASKLVSSGNWTNLTLPQIKELKVDLDNLDVLPERAAKTMKKHFDDFYAGYEQNTQITPATPIDIDAQQALLAEMARPEFKDFKTQADGRLLPVYEDGSVGRPVGPRKPRPAPTLKTIQFGGQDLLVRGGQIIGQADRPQDLKTTPLDDALASVDRAQQEFVSAAAAGASPEELRKLQTNINSKIIFAEGKLTGSQTADLQLDQRRLAMEIVVEQSKPAAEQDTQKIQLAIEQQRELQGRIASLQQAVTESGAEKQANTISLKAYEKAERKMVAQDSVIQLLDNAEKLISPHSRTIVASVAEIRASIANQANAIAASMNLADGAAVISEGRRILLEETESKTEAEALKKLGLEGESAQAKALQTQLMYAILPVLREDGAVRPAQQMMNEIGSLVETSGTFEAQIARFNAYRGLATRGRSQEQSRLARLSTFTGSPRKDFGPRFRENLKRDGVADLDTLRWDPTIEDWTFQYLDKPGLELQKDAQGNKITYRLRDYELQKSMLQADRFVESEALRQ